MEERRTIGGEGVGIREIVVGLANGFGEGKGDIPGGGLKDGR